MQATRYRYRYNGKEQLSRFGGRYDYGFRMYDAGLARFLSVDRMVIKYPEFSPYSMAVNSPIFFVDVDGNDVGVIVTAKRVGTTMINLYSSKEIEKNPELKYKTMEVPVYEVNLKNQSGSSATYFFTRINYRGDKKGNVKDVTFDAIDDCQEYFGVIKSRWGARDNVLELRNNNDINNQSIPGMKGETESNRVAIQFHVKGASDGCMLAVGLNDFTSVDEEKNSSLINVKRSSKATQNAFMSKIKELANEDIRNGYGKNIKVNVEKLPKGGVKHE